MLALAIPFVNDFFAFEPPAHSRLASDRVGLVGAVAVIAIGARTIPRRTQ